MPHIGSIFHDIWHGMQRILTCGTEYALKTDETHSRMSFITQVDRLVAVAS